jgi:hypothetical protein
MWQRASWPNVCPTISAIIDDMHHLSTAAAKIDHYFAHRRVIGHGVTDFVATELEYVFTLCRSVFDLLQVATGKLWDRIQLVGPSAPRHKNRLPESFADVIFAGGSPRDVNAIIAKYGVTPGLAAAYHDAGAFFEPVRAFRDDVVHRGHGIQTIFDTDKGFCVDSTKKPFDKFPIWKDSHQYGANNLVSLRPLLAHLVFGTIGACGAFTTALGGEIKFPPPIAPNHRIFLRGYHTAAFHHLDNVLRGGDPWWDSTAASGS